MGLHSPPDVYEIPINHHRAVPPTGAGVVVPTIADLPATDDTGELLARAAFHPGAQQEWLRYDVRDRAVIISEQQPRQLQTRLVHHMITSGGTQYVPE
jgi:hypothetical protein